MQECWLNFLKKKYEGKAKKSWDPFSSRWERVLNCKSCRSVRIKDDSNLLPFNKLNWEEELRSREHRNCFSKDMDSLRSEKVLAGWSVAEQCDSSLKASFCSPIRRHVSLASVLRWTSDSSVSLYAVGNAGAKWWRALRSGCCTGACGYAECWASELSGLNELMRTLRQYLIKWEERGRKYCSSKEVLYPLKYLTVYEQKIPIFSYLKAWST